MEQPVDRGVFRNGGGVAGRASPGECCAGRRDRVRPRADSGLWARQGSAMRRRPRSRTRASLLERWRDGERWRGRTGACRLIPRGSRLRFPGRIPDEYLKRIGRSVRRCSTSAGIVRSYSGMMTGGAIAGAAVGEDEVFVYAMMFATRSHMTETHPRNFPRPSSAEFCSTCATSRPSPEFYVLHFGYRIHRDGGRSHRRAGRAPEGPEPTSCFTRWAVAARAVRPSPSSCSMCRMSTVSAPGRRRRGLRSVRYTRATGTRSPTRRIRRGTRSPSRAAPFGARLSEKPATRCSRSEYRLTHCA